MPRQAFVLPNTVASHYTTKTGEEKAYSAGTIKVYQTKLNSLASEGITSASDILQNQDKVITIAKAKTKGDKSKMRLFLSAVFYAVNDSPLEAKLKLYNEFQSCKDEPYQKFKSGELLIADDAEN